MLLLRSSMDGGRVCVRACAGVPGIGFGLVSQHVHPVGVQACQTALRCNVYLSACCSYAQAMIIFVSAQLHCCTTPNGPTVYTGSLRCCDAGKATAATAGTAQQPPAFEASWGR
jgi:hypothetical protein